MQGRFSLRSNQNTLRDLNERSTNITKESAFRTREMLKLMHECQDAGVNTLKNLCVQGEKLTRADDALDATEIELDKAELRLQNIKRKENLPFYLLPCASCFQKDPDKEYQSPPKPVADDDTIKLEKDKDKTPNIEKDSSPPFSIINDEAIRKPDLPSNAKFPDSNYPTVKEGQSNANFPDSSYSKLKEGPANANFPDSKVKEGDSRFFPKIINTPEEAEIESNLGQVSNHIRHLKNIATDMNLETGNQNELLGKMNVKAARNLTKLDSVTKTTRHLVNDGKPSSRPCCCCFL